MLLGSVVVFVPAFRSPAAQKPIDARLGTRAGLVVAFVLAPICLALSIAHLANSKFNPLIYFRF